VKILKITSIILVVLFVIAYFAFCFFTAPKSDATVLKKFVESEVIPKISRDNFKGFEFRKIEVKKNNTNPTLVFIHGTIGSLNDFNKYLSDADLQASYNMIAYDRIGYNYKDINNTQESIAFERDLLDYIVKDLDKENLVVFGYSFGGPIALSYKKKVKRVVLLAPAIYSEFEVVPWALNFYKWKLTRWLVPKVWKEASKEKMSHQKDLKKFEKDWNKTPNNIVSIHGDKDWIVPFDNSLMLQNKMNTNQFELITIPEAGHGLLWSEFKKIKKELLNILD